MGAQIPLCKEPNGPSKVPFASFCFFIAASFGIAFHQEGEFVQQQGAAIQREAQTLQQRAQQAAKQTVKVPPLIKTKLPEAERLVRASDLVIGEPRFIASSEPPGTVVEQEPGAGSLVRRGATVLVWVSTEQSPPRQELVPVPRLIRHRRDDAIRMLQHVGLQVRPSGIEESPSQGEPGIVLSQDPLPETMVSPGTSVTFTVSRQIERKLALQAFPASIRPGESVTLTAELNPPLDGAEYQFSSGTGASSGWSVAPQAQFTYFNDGNYQAAATARWSDGSVKSDPVPIVVHAVKYEVRLVPHPLDVKPGGTVSFRAEVSPKVERATYTYHFGDTIPNFTSSLPTTDYPYQKAGKYTAWVTVRIAETTGAAGSIHSHDFPSSPVPVTVEPPLPPPRPRRSIPRASYVIGAAILIGVVGYATWKILHPKLQILVHKDTGIQSLESTARMPTGVGLEIHAVRSWGEQSIKSQGPLWARIETINE